MKKTIVHVPSLLGCTARGDTTQEALDNAPAAITAFSRFLARAGERVDAKAKFQTKVAEHLKEGGFLGAVWLPTDAEPMPVSESNVLMKRLDALHGELRRISGGLTAAKLDARPSKGRPIGQILQHVCAEGGYLRGVSGASRIQRLVEQKQLDALDALDQLHALETARLKEMAPDERAAVIMRGQSPWSVRRAMRNMLEHAWEHYVEIAERLGKEP
jgi:predicted RNase H-like HicB family nuclease